MAKERKRKEGEERVTYGRDGSENERGKRRRGENKERENRAGEKVKGYGNGEKNVRKRMGNNRKIREHGRLKRG